MKCDFTNLKDMGEREVMKNIVSSKSHSTPQHSMAFRTSTYKLPSGYASVSIFPASGLTTGTLS